MFFSRGNIDLSDASLPSHAGILGSSTRTPATPSGSIVIVSCSPMGKLSPVRSKVIHITITDTRKWAVIKCPAALDLDPS